MNFVKSGVFRGAQVSVPWARQGSGFTLLFEALLMTLVREMPVRAVARLVREHDTRVWREQLDGLQDRNLQTALAYRMRLTFQEIFTVQNRHQGASLLKEWMVLAKDSGLPPMVKVAYTIMNHWEGILRWFESHITNGILEGFNSLLQSAKSKARGYRTRKNFIHMAYLILGKLDFQLPT